jgi:hypothetical protein
MSASSCYVCTAALRALVLLFGTNACSVYDRELIEPAGAGGSLDAHAQALDDSPAGSAGGAAPSQPPMAAEPVDAAAPAARCAHSDASDYCASLPALPSSPVIDGQLECGLTLSPIAPAGWNGSAPMPASSSASYAAAWRPDGIYLYVEVQSAGVAPHAAADPIFCGDAVELYLDAAPHPTAPDKYGSATMQFVISAPSAPDAAPEAVRFVQGAPQGAWISQMLRTSVRADGYSVEAFISAADVGLWQWSPAAFVAFSIAIDVSGAAGDPALHCGSQLGQYFLKVTTPGADCRGEPWCDATAFCSPALEP